MRSFVNFIIIFFIPFFTLTQEPKKLTLEDIYYSNTFSQDWVWGLNSMKNGKEYTVIDYIKNDISIDKYSYKSGKKINSILKSSEIDSLKFDGYKFNSNEEKLLLKVNTESIYRYSDKSFIYAFDIKSKELIKISDEKISLADFSPNGKMVSYVFDNNLYIYELSSGKTTKCTTDGVRNKIINGATDWVYEEEFAIVKGYEWSHDSKFLAYYKFDESNVKEFSMDLFNQNLYPTQEKFKYPKAGEENSKVSIHILNVNTKKSFQVNENDFEYTPRIYWTKDSKNLCVFKLNRHQNHLKLLFTNPESKKTVLVYEEKDGRYIDIHDNIKFLNTGFIWSSEKNGFNHLYKFSYDSKKMFQITSGEYEITKFYGYNESKKILYYQSNEKSPLQKHIYSINIDGTNKKLLSNAKGVNNANFSKTFDYFINTNSTANQPNYITLNNKKGKLIRVIKNSEKLVQTLSNYELSKKEFFSFKTEYNISLNGWMIKPPDFDSNKKYPVLMYVYGGPGNQQVLDNWGGRNYMWYQYLAQQGIVIVCVDNRGTGGRGADFKKCTYKELGKLETEDQIAANKYLASLDYIDQNKIGIWGWSYGGYMSSLCLLKGNDIFNFAIAVAPVTNWRFYDTIYTERYMRTPQENPDGYDLNSPINYIKQLRGNYLLVHGSADDNVHYQNTMEMISSLVKENKQFDLFIYPDKNHGIYGGTTRLHLMTKITDFIIKNL
ncbi:MAG: S9 family peptidase [Bacteroidota bacterium]|nr:S9 family peptidase [Bacteroidota bacterium]